MASSEIARIKARAKSRKKINDVYEDSLRAYVVHYSCQSFYDNPSGTSKRVTSVAVRNLQSAQTKSWSIHQSAELVGELHSITDNLDRHEMRMLEGYFGFLEAHRDATFIHWNMRDENYGFAALEHRFRVLGGQPFELLDDRKLDLAREVVSLYGLGYVPHESPTGKKGRLMVLVEKNHMADIGALQGQEEAEAFERGEYLKLHQSTLRKVDILHNIFDRVHAKTLKTDASFADKYGIHPVAIAEVVKNHWLTTVLLLLAAICGAVVKYSNFFSWLWPSHK